MHNTTGTIFQIQRCCLHDGSGIRTTVFLKGCPLRCAWCANPESQNGGNELYQVKRGCIRCGLCVGACPSGAIRWEADAIAVDREACTQCMACTRVCPVSLFHGNALEVTVGDVMAEVLKDRTFYDVSGGGLTLSGGEPLYQPAFAHELLCAAKSAGISTAIETSLYAPFHVIEPLLPLLDEIFYDVKHCDSQKHLAYTGVGNELIRSNTVRLLALRPDAQARIPVIPSFNDSADDIDMMTGYLKSLGIHSVQLMRYHNLAGAKYAALGRAYAYEKVPPHTEQAFARIKSPYEAAGISVL